MPLTHSSGSLYRSWYNTSKAHNTNMHYKKIFLFTIPVVIAGLLVLLLVAYNRMPTPTVPPIATQDELPAGIQNNPTDQQQPQPTAAGRSDPQAEKPSDIPSNTAPKQSQIATSIEQEVVYYPLRTANDPGYAASWALQKMKAPAAWDISTGTSSTVIAVIDSGFALGHDDLKDAWHINSGEQGLTQLGDRCWTGISSNKQTNACDDDNNGYVDDWRGWNFVLVDNNPQAGRENPNGEGVSHGTEVAGLAGASGNNNAGITTLSWNTRIMPLQALSDDGPGFTSDVVAAMYYAVDNGADVINLSLGSNTYDAAVKQATDYAYANDVIVVAAAGNCGSGTEPGCSGYGAGFIGYPARNPHVIAVGATTSTDARASFSSYGDFLDVVAPGSGSIYTPTWTPGNQTSLYGTAVYGTSYSAPYVASLVALIKSVRPTTSTADIHALLLATTSKPTGMSGQPYTTQFGHGIIDAERALTVATGLNSSAAAPELSQAGGPKSEQSFVSASTLGSGCTTDTPSTYCSIWMQDARTANHRYLPYALTSGSAVAGWTWPTSMLSAGAEWSLRAVQGEFTSTEYTLINK